MSTKRPPNPSHRSLPPPTQYKPSTIEVYAVKFLGGHWVSEVDQIAQEFEASDNDSKRRRLYLQAHRVYHQAVTAARDRSDCPANLFVKLTTYL